MGSIKTLLEEIAVKNNLKLYFFSPFKYSDCIEYVIVAENKEEAWEKLARHLKEKAESIRDNYILCKQGESIHLYAGSNHLYVFV